MQAHITTSLVGERAGEIFRDIYIRDADGKFLVNGSEGKPVLDIQHPIQRIAVRTRFAAVDSLSVTYQLEGGGNVTLDRGFQVPDPNAGAIDFTGQTPFAVMLSRAESERLVGVFGRTGFHPWYRTNAILALSLVIFDTAKGTTRVVDTLQPSGTDQAAPSEATIQEGTRFYVSDVLAFGGFEVLGTGFGTIPGLFFYKDAGAQ
ncbi:hypothetical protein C8Q70DRAFT_930443 [Cubamyces menziesii]|nr:hypothetical protein C8Q70DRAFT_930443 [Cubamyces menziesii]